MENAVITNEGRALLTSVIANNGTLTFTVAKVSDTDYVGQEATLTLGTFAGTFMEQTVSASVQNTTTIKVATTIYDSGNNHITEAHEIKSVGIVATDGNTTALLVVCTTSNPSTIEPGNDPNDPTSLDVEVNLGVSSTQNITVVGSAAGVLHTSDVVDSLTSTAVNEPLSANMGRVLNEQSSAITNVYGSKNLNIYPYKDTTKTLYGITFTDNGDGTVTVSGTALGTAVFDMHLYLNNPCIVENGTYILSGCPSGGGIGTYNIRAYEKNSGGTDVIIGNDYGNGVTLTLNGDYYDNNSVHLDLAIVVTSGAVISTPITFKPMLRDERITDTTFVPFTKTNLQLTEDVSGLSNENLIDNAWFTVNQRGFTSQTMLTNYSPIIDRWIGFSTDGGTLTLNANGLSFDKTGYASPFFFTQKMEGLTLGKTYTLSVLFSDGTIEHSTEKINSTSDKVEFLLSGSRGLARVYYYASWSQWLIDIVAYAGVNYTIRAVKLEIGSKSTLAHDVAPNYTAELLKCQRYLCQDTSKSSYAEFGLVCVDSTTEATLIYKLPVQMRATPTFTYLGAFVIVEGGSTHAVTDMTLSNVETDNEVVIKITSSGLTSGNVGRLRCDSIGDYIRFSADL